MKSGENPHQMIFGKSRQAASRFANSVSLQRSQANLLEHKHARSISTEHEKIACSAEGDYHQWIAENEPTHEDLVAQREWSNRCVPARISLITPTYRTSLKILEAAWQSLQRQTYPHWQWCVAVARDESRDLQRCIARMAKEDPRITIAWTATNEGISCHSNAALQVANGDFIAILDHDDMLPAHALYEVARVLEADPDCDFIYSDEDHLTADGRLRYAPVAKPAWSPELFLGHNYICHLAVIRKHIVDAIGGFQSKYDGAQDWDLFFRVSERTSHIHHIAKILYHWRALPESCAADIAAKPYAVEAQRRAVTDHLRRREIVADVVTMPNQTQRVTWEIKSKPSVSIIIPNRDQPQLLRQCITGLIQRTTYGRCEIIVVDNDSTDAETIDYYRQLARDDVARVVPFEGPFNYSAACNTGARSATGDVLLFLNNDTEVLDGDWLDELVRWVMLPSVGVVGAKLLFPDGRIQHAGMALGHMALCGHLFYESDEGSANLFGSTNQYRNLSALTGACHLIQRDVFEALGGYDEQYVLAYSDCALCLQATRAGYRNIYTPYARLIHHECATRKGHVPREDERRFAQLLEQSRFIADPYYSPMIDARSFDGRMRVQSNPSSDEVIRQRIEFAAHGDVSQSQESPIHQIWRHRADLRHQCPDALLPSGWQGYRRWLERCGTAEYGQFEPEVFDEFEVRVQRRSSQDLAESYLLNPPWQKTFPLAFTIFDRGRFMRWIENRQPPGHSETTGRPHALTPVQQIHRLGRVHPEVGQLLRQIGSEEHAVEDLSRWVHGPGRRAFDLPSDWLAEFDAEVQTGAVAKQGINFVGYLGYSAGLGEAARGMHAALETTGIPMSVRNVPHTMGSDKILGLDSMGLDLYDKTLMVLQPDALGHHLGSCGTSYRRAGYHIGMWTWELENVPETWNAGFERVDEVWTPSHFVAEAVRRATDLPVQTVPYCVEIDQVASIDRALLGVPDDHFMFLFMFDNSSVMERKNPLAVIKAFKQAFALGDKATLVLKVGRANHDPLSFAHLRQQTANHSIRLLTTPLSRARCNGLMNAADCYVSLHRSEGFGLTLAEAMLLGKPVIATAYSGNMDFMTTENSLPVDYRLIDVPAGLPFYKPGNRWADPSVEHAANWMRWAFDNRDAAAEVGHTARQQVQAMLSSEAIGRRIATRLAEIDHAERPCAPVEKPTTEVEPRRTAPVQVSS